MTKISKRKAFSAAALYYSNMITRLNTIALLQDYLPFCGGDCFRRLEHYGIRILNLFRISGFVLRIFIIVSLTR